MKLYCNSVLPWVQLEIKLHSISTSYFLFIKHTNIPSMVPHNFIHTICCLQGKTVSYFMCFIFINSTQKNSFILIILGWDISWDMIKFVDEWQAGLQQSWLLWLYHSLFLLYSDLTDGISCQFFSRHKSLIMFTLWVIPK